MLGRRHDVGVGSIADDDALFGRGFDVDVVDADARAPDDAQLASCVENSAGHLGTRPYDHAVVVADTVDKAQLVKVKLDRDRNTPVLEHGNARGIEFVSYQNFLLHGCFPLIETNMSQW